jgi:hypothetical protein
MVMVISFAHSKPLPARLQHDKPDTGGHDKADGEDDAVGVGEVVRQHGVAPLSASGS